MNPPIALGTYNPSQVPKDVLLAEFTARKSMLEELIATLRSNTPEEPCQHSLLIGPRGFGKTTSLFALKYKLEDDPELSQQWIPLLFDEENYQIADLTGFWLECLRLAEAALGTPTVSNYETLSVSRDPKLEILARDAFLALIDQQRRRALLLIDNINDILAVVSDENEQHRLRAFLLEESRVCIVGTASTYFEAVTNVDQPFYNLFRVFRLDRFTPEELRTALEAMSNARPSDSARIPLPKDKGYWLGLNILTGGNPRLVKMIFQLMEQGVTADFRAQLEGLLDAYTPYFKHRIETMSPQQRRVFDAIALAWDPVQIGDIAPGLRIESNQISAQVRALIEAQLVSIAAGSPKRRTYQIADRFSNIYYFMRYSRAGRCKFEWFVLTMKAILTPEQFRSQLDHMRTLGLSCVNESELREQTQLIVSATQAIDDPQIRLSEVRKSVAAYLGHTQEAAIDHLLEAPTIRDLLAEEHSVLGFFKNISREERKRINYKPEDANWWYRLTDFAEAKSLWAFAEIAYRKAIEINPNHAPAWNGLGNLLQNYLGRSNEAISAYEQSIKIDSSYPTPWNGLGNVLQHHCKHSEAEAAYKKAMELDPSCAPPWNGFGNLLLDFPDRLDEAEKAYRRAIELDPTLAVPWYGLGNLLHYYLGRFTEAEVAYERAIDLDPSFALSWDALGNLLKNHLRLFERAEIAYKRAIESNPTYAVPWNGLGNLFQDHLGRFEEAETAYRKSIDLDPSYAAPWNGLGNLLKNRMERFTEAEAAYRKATQLDPSFAASWNGLANLLTDFGRIDEAEAAYRRAIESDPTRAIPWNGLANLLRLHRQNFAEAESAYKKASEIDPSYASPWNGLGNLLQDDFSRFEEAEVAYKNAIKLDPSDPLPLNGLGNLLQYKLGRFNEAETAYREAIKLNPSLSRTWNGLGNLLQDHLGRVNEAMASYKKAIELNPRSALPKANLADLLFQLKAEFSEAIKLATESVMLSPEAEWPRHVFRNVAINDPGSALCVLDFLVPKLAENARSISADACSSEKYALAIDCVASLLQSNMDKKALELIAQPSTADLFDIPIRAIQLRQGTLDRSTLATERLALVEAFLEKVAMQTGN